ncbi:MAG TPA: sigma-54 dependent transcriptional regulator, partial [Phycisphaerales bacterium]|nr:sigma-54 dependent transcriptional regulator [Phycisphaerales bacterium]
SAVQALQIIQASQHVSIDSNAKPGEQVSAVGVVVTDLVMPGMSGMDLLKALRKDHPEIVPVVITGYGTIESAVQAIKLGAVDYLTKPLVDHELRIAVEKAVRQHVLLAENARLKDQLDQRHGFDGILGSDPRMRRIFDTIQAVAASKATVLMSGESGTGKSLIARAIHRYSQRADKPFVEVSCGSLPEPLLESELFGHVKGAFTGAHADKIGRFQAAHTGTLFLDEINSASPAMQLKLLRLLQERKFEPVGSSKTIEVDVRVILASNQPLEALVADGQFRQDLYYRVNVVMIQVPSLRNRIMDIPLLAEHFLKLKAREAGKQILGFTQQAMDVLKQYSFPGNVRELENFVERAVVLTRSTRIDVADLPPQVAEVSTNDLSRSIMSPGAATWKLAGHADRDPLPLHKALEEPEKQIILAALKANDWNRQKTADQLQINRTTLYKKMKQYGLDSYEFGQAV